MTARLQTLAVVLALLGAGVLLGSFLTEWRGRTLETPGLPVSIRGVPGSPGAGGAAGRVNVEVLNGSGARGAAAQVTEALRSAGFDVKTFGNAPSFDYSRTLVIDRSGRAEAARSVAEALGLDSVRSELRPELYLDATVILGRDWAERLDHLR